MCGRYAFFSTRVSDWPQLQQSLRTRWNPDAPELEPRYNIAPSQRVAGVLHHSAGDRPQLALFRWGLIPSWAKDPSIGSRLINARAETIGSKPSFRVPLRRQRCLLLADGFYEWHRDPVRKRSIPYFVRLSSEEPFTFAGLWSDWTAPSGQHVLSCTIVTCEANALVRRIHPRMPVILAPEFRTLWLDPSEQKRTLLEQLLVPYSPTQMEMYPVSPYVNAPRNDDARCIAPAA